ncbi:MAG TPA: peptidase G2 autoproteolytic cleavage domain-containing protein [Pyrinomonadaceae bacterium]|nr:peptidase G2 autoproteolytic cleavage domain-containing protein [Pyrinomonadaceae bacterium]
MKTNSRSLKAKIWLATAVSFVLLLLAGTASAQWTGTTNINNTNSGNVGIGTASPTYRLEVFANPGIASALGLVFNSASEQAFHITNTNTGGNTWSLGPGIGTSASTFGIYAFGSGIMQTIDTSGNTAMVGHLTVLGTGNSSIAGNVGIGTNAPGEKLEVAGNLKLTGSGNIDAAGTITGANIKAKFQDMAEWVPSSEQIPAGTVVVLDATKSNQVIQSTKAYDTRVAGVVSEKPGITLGESGANKVLVATTGRVLIKVDASNGAIHIGDLLVTSDSPGVAMKSEPITIGNRKMHMPGTLIGKALEPLEKGSGKILVLLSLQ